MQSSSSSTSSGPTSTSATCAVPWRNTRPGVEDSADAEPRTFVTPFVSRIVVSAIGLPLVLGAVYVGGWWMFGLVLLAAVIALHEYWLLAHPLRPLAPAGYIGAALGLVGAE